MFGHMLIVALAILGIATGSSNAQQPELNLRWVYLQQNLQVADNRPQIEAILRRAKAAGYNGVVLADFKLNILDRVPEHYFLNVRRFKQTCDELGLEIIPCVASFGYSEGVLVHDPNLAAAMPVVDQPLLVSGAAIEVLQPGGNLLTGDFEKFDNHEFQDWDWQDEPGAATFVDSMIKHGGGSSLRIEAPLGAAGNRRVSKKIATRPWCLYHASCWIRTENFESAGDMRMFAMGNGGRVLSHTSLGVAPTQDWTEHHILFNSLDNEEVRFYLGVWNGRGGRLWLDDVVVGDEAFDNLVRRDDAPLTIVAEKDRTPYEEGRDYAIVRDPRLLASGGFDRWHSPVAVARTAGSRIGEGERLLASYYHTLTFNDGQVCASLTAPKVFEVVEDQVRRVNELLHPKTFFLSHDEIRLAGWSKSEIASGTTPGQQVAANVRRCSEIVRSVNPQARLCIWSDMFDPSHNAVSNYYLVNGELAGSWEGLPPNAIVVNWNQGRAAQSVPFFAQRGHGQILAGYYDGPPDRIRDWLAIGLPTGSIRGAMYTTWRRNYDDLERFAQAAWGNVSLP